MGVISDTHGLLRPEALAALEGSERIVHAGDIGSPLVLEALRTLAPVTAVRGNNDTEAWAGDLPDTVVLEIGEVRLFVLHDVKALPLDPLGSGFQAVIAGHSHRPMAEVRDEVLFFNPGSAGPRRFELPVTVGRLRITGRRIDAEIVPIR